MAVDGQGNLLVADSAYGLIRVVAVSTGTFYGQAMTAGDIYTVAGTVGADSFGDGGPAPAASFNGPESVAVDGSGNLFIADPYNNRIREVMAEPTAQAVAFTSTVPADPTVGGTYQVTATGGGSGNPATFTVDASATAVCSISGSTVTFTGAGTCVVDAEQAGGGDYSAAGEVQESFTVSAP